MAHRGFQGVSRQFRSYPLQSVLLIAAVALGVAVVTAVAAFLDLNRQAFQAGRKALEPALAT